MTAPTVSIRQLTPQPVLLTRRKIADSEIAATLGEILPVIFGYAQRSATPVAGQPFTRYVQIGRGTMTIEAGLPVAGTPKGDGAIEASELAGGTVAVATHLGPYDNLHQTHVAVEQWIDANKYVAAGPPWEVYVTDPGETPNPAEWRTDVFYPVKPR